jgi:hypothetical protein
MLCSALPNGGGDFATALEFGGPARRWSGASKAPADRNVPRQAEGRERGRRRLDSRRGGQRRGAGHADGMSRCPVLPAVGRRRKRFRIASEAAAMALIVGTVSLAMRTVAGGESPAAVARFADTCVSSGPPEGSTEHAMTANGELFAELRKIDTPTITNVVATYPKNPLCLGLYNPWTENWYTDTSIRCMYPELGRSSAMP